MMHRLALPGGLEGLRLPAYRRQVDETPKERLHHTMSEKGWAAAPATNWDEIADAPPPPPPAGIYGFTIASAEPHVTQKGQGSVNLELTVTHPDGGIAGDLNATCYATCMLEGNARFRTKQLMQAVGIDPPSDNELDTITQWCEDLTGRSGYAQFKQRSYTPRGSAEERQALDVERFLNDETLPIARAKLAGGAIDAAAPAEQPQRRSRGRKAA